MAYDKSATIYGIRPGNIQWNDDFTATRSLTNKWNASETFTCRINEVTSLIPLKGSACTFPGFEFITCDSVKVSNIGGDLATVKVEYGGLGRPDSEGGGDGGDDVGNDYTLELSIETGEEPLQTLKKYKDIDSGEKEIIQNILSGKLVAVKNKSYYYRNADENEYAFEVTIASELGRELIDFLLRGVTSYLVPRTTLRYSYTSRQMPSLNGVGKIAIPPKGGGSDSWLYMGAQMTESGGVYEITKEYLKSQDGDEWDDKIYTKDEPA